MPNGKKTWFIADGYLPFAGEKPEGTVFEGHEAIMILNCNDFDVTVEMDIFFEDRNPVTGVKLYVPAERIRSFHMQCPDEIGGVELQRQQQYALRFRADAEVIVQYGRMDVSQPNLAYMALMGHAE